MDIFFKTISGRTIVLQIADTDLVEDVKGLLNERGENCPTDELRLLYAGKQLIDGRTISDYNIGSHATIHVTATLAGGKGGFGAMLRRLAKQSGPKKTTDFGACRDLSGRRIRHVNDEKILQKWKEAKDRGEDFDVEQETPSGIGLWFLPTPSWAEGFGKNQGRKRFMKPRRKTQMCTDWVRSREGRSAPRGAPAHWGCPRGVRCEFAHGEGELRGAGAEALEQSKKRERAEAEEKKRRSYMGDLDRLDVDDDDAMQRMIEEGLRAAKKLKVSKGTESSTDNEMAESNPIAEHAAVVIDLPISSSSASAALDEESSTAPGLFPALSRSLSSYPLLSVLSGVADIDADAVTRGLEDFSSVAAVDCSVCGTGNWFYEIEVLTGGLVQVGWATERFKQEKRSRGALDDDASVDAESDGVGDDAHSWSFDGARGKKWHVHEEDYGLDRYSVKTKAWTEASEDTAGWKAGDVVGCLLTIDPTGEVVISFLLNGEFLGEAFHLKLSHAAGLLFPAFSLEGGEVVAVNLGQKLFHFAPADESVYAEAMRLLRIDTSDAIVKPSLSNAHAGGYRAVVEAFVAKDENSRSAGIPALAQEPPSSSSIPHREITLGPIDLESDLFQSPAAVEGLGLARLKDELEQRGLKAGGSVVERASRLFAVRGVPPEKIDPKLLKKK